MRKLLAVALASFLAAFLLVGFTGGHGRVTQFDLQDWLPVTQLGPGVIYDSGVVSVPNGQSLTSPVFSVAPFAKVGVIYTMGVAGSASASVQWWKDAAGTLPAAANLNMRKGGTTGTGAVFPVMSPYANFTFTNTTGAASNMRIVLFGYTTTSEVLPAVLTGQLGGNTQSASVPSLGGISIGYPTTIAGRMTVGAHLPASGNVQVQYQSGGGAWATFIEQEFAASFDTNFDFNAPLDDWRVVLSNTSGGAVNGFVSVQAVNG